MTDTTICSVDGCDKPVRSKALCVSHYYRERRHGTADGGGQSRSKRGEPMRWLKAHVGFSGDECLPWPFNRFPGGYGSLVENGKKVGAHRKMCELRNGPALPEMEAAHSCGKGHMGCVNPNHLTWKTTQENQHDRRVHGTSSRGEGNGNSILTEEDVGFIRSAKGVLTPSELSYIFGVSTSAINRVLSGASWSHGT